MNSTTVRLELGERSYSIDIGAGILTEPGRLSAHIGGPDVLIVSHETVAPIYLDRVAAGIDTASVTQHIVPDGEQFKNLAQIESIYDTLVSMRANRDTTVVALGGGVVGDMAGFAAATYQRGVPVIQLPTTLLSQVDSSVGGKTGVNLRSGKNLVGAFHQPAYVLIDTQTLDTLPDRELSAGLAEVIKHGLVRDGEFFGWLESNIGALRSRDAEALNKAIFRSCQIKAEVVAADEREAGQRALLNLGHTFGHAIETVSGYGEWLHGEAVGAGLVMAATASDLPAAEIARVRALVQKAGLPTEPPKVGVSELRSAMQMDKKVVGKQLRFVLLNAIGDGFVSSDYDEQAISSALAPADG